MQTRSQTRKLLNDPKNEMFEIPVVKAAERPTTVKASERPTTVKAAERPTTVKAAERPTTVKAAERPTTTKVSARVLPDSIINGPSTPINCALFLPKYIQKPVYEVDIDFDEASEAWRANKTSIGNGQYKYKGNRRFPL
jgi:hypothetical protein